MSEKCVVPNCKNPTNTGIQFPKQAELREKWLESLNLAGFEPDAASFVCLDHFGEDDLVDHVSNSNLEDVLKALPIPTVLSPKTAEDDEKGENEETKVCRLCMGDRDIEVNVFDYWDETLTIAEVITSCIPLIKISKTDNLSKFVCTKCLDMTKLFYKFRNTCVEMDEKQKELSTKSLKRKSSSNPGAPSKKLYLNLAEDESAQVEAPKQKSETISYIARSEIDRKFDKVEAEVMKVLEGRLPEEMKSADNIIIEVQSDDEAEEASSGCEVSENVVKIGSSELKLPKGIKVSVPVKYQSKIGTFKAKTIKGLYDSEFCLVDNYLFEFRLCKGSSRHLKCMTSKCAATGRQNFLKQGVFEDKVAVKTAHNHPPPPEDEMKKQMFYHVMRRKMQNDKTLNFRNVYDVVCETDPEIKELVPLKNVINQICCHQLTFKLPQIRSFEQFYDLVEDDSFQKLHFTHSNKQFYQEKFTAEDGSKAVVFASCETIEQLSRSKIMYVDASFKIDTKEEFKYHLVTILVWVDDSYYPILFALVNEKSQEIYKAIFSYLHDTLAPKLRPREIVTDYEACLYYALGETYLESHIGGSVFYYTQNLYKKICSLNLSRDLEKNSCFRNIYHMILMLPLLPVNTILDGLNNIELQANELSLTELTRPIFDYVRSQWIVKVTPELFCVHRLENRINENVIAPFKKLRDFLMLSKGKMQKQQITIVSVVEKLIELEGFLQAVYSAPVKKSFARDLSSSQKKNVIRAWQFIESHPKININNFFTKVLGYIKCMENQLWIWGFYRYTGDASDDLINAANFSIVNSNENEEGDGAECVYPAENVVMDVVIDQNDGFLVKETEVEGQAEIVKAGHFQSAYMNYVSNKDDL